jgi:geranylgeranyl diphosphate synthase, type I
MMSTSVNGRVRVTQQVLQEARVLVEPAHREAVDRLPEPVRHIAGYHAGWWDAYGRTHGSGGKSMRPALVLAAAAAVGGDCADAVPEAVAVELVHDFSLLHDDVMDGDLTRRHRPAAWSLFGVGEAVLAGDMLVSLACDLLAERPGLKILTTAVLELCTGQSADMTFEKRVAVGVEECVAMTAGKTGALLACACELGALAGGGDARQCRAMAEFGHHLGLAFQLVDDLLGIWGDPIVTGKPAGSDLANRKKSLPVVAALASGTPSGDRLAELYQAEGTLDQEAVACAAGLIDEAGGRSWARAEADRRQCAALAALEGAGPVQGRDADLKTLADLITRRDR